MITKPQHPVTQAGLTTDSVESLKSRIAELESQVRELQSHERQLDLVINSTGVGIWDWEIPTGKAVYNERWANIIGYTLKEISPLSIETWVRFVHPDDLLESNRLLKEYWAGQCDSYIFEGRMRHKDGHWVWIYDTGRVIEWGREGKPKRMIGTHLDITEHKVVELRLAHANKKLKKLSYIDSLTQIPNRRAYDKKLSEEISAARRSKTVLSLLLIDIDHFKQYNDLYGHEQGDLALIKVAKQIQASLPRKTDFVARYGGEEIVVLLPYTHQVNAAIVARKIIDDVAALNIEHYYSQYDRRLTVSVGISSSSQDFNALLVHADKALYRAKRSGRNRYVTFSDGSVDGKLIVPTVEPYADQISSK